MAETALVPMDNLDVAKVFQNKDELELVLKNLEDKALSIVSDPTTKKGRDEIKSTAFRVSRSKTFLVKEAEKLTKEWRDQTSAVNASKKIVIQFCDDLRDKVRKPATDFDNAEKDRVAAHQQRLATIEELAATVDESGQSLELSFMESQLEILEKVELGETWQEFAGVAAKTKDECVARLKAAIDRQVKYVAEQAELAKLRAEAAERERIEYEQKLKEEAAEKARLEAEARAKAERERVEAEKQAAIDEAERKEREAKEAAEKAERDRLAAIEAQKQAEKRAEEERIAAEKRAEAEKQAAIKAAEEKARQEAERLERERLAKEADEEAERKRIAADKEHRRHVNRSALISLEQYGIDTDIAKEVIRLIADGRVDYVSIDYTTR